MSDHVVSVEISKPCKLTANQVLEIRNSPGVSSYTLSEKFGVNQSTVWRIRVHKKHRRGPEGETTKKIREGIISLGNQEGGRFTDRNLQTIYKKNLHECVYVIDGLIEDGIVEVCGRPGHNKEKFFVYKLTEKGMMLK